MSAIARPPLHKVRDVARVNDANELSIVLGGLLFDLSPALGEQDHCAELVALGNDVSSADGSSRRTRVRLEG